MSLAKSRAKNLLSFATQNFALSSAIIGLFGYLLGTVFLYSYLSFFDWRLIWLVEQSDILKFGVVAVACFSSCSGFMWMFAEDVANLYKESGRVVLVAIILLAVILSVGISARLYTETQLYAEPQYSFAILTRLAPFVVLLDLIILTRSFANEARYTLTAAVSDLSITLVTVAVLGATLAVCVRDLDGFEQDVTVDGQVWSRAGVIWATPHHTVLFSKGIITAVPSASVARIETRSPETRARRPVKPNA